MNDTLNVRIELPVENLTGESLLAASQQLRALNSEIQRSLEIDSQVEEIKSLKNTQSGDIATAIALFNLSLTALGLIWSIIQVRRRGSITIERTWKDGTKKVLVKDNLTDIEFQKYEEEIKQDIEAQKLQDLIIRIDA